MLVLPHSMLALWLDWDPHPHPPKETVKSPNNSCIGSDFTWCRGANDNEQTSAPRLSLHERRKLSCLMRQKWTSQYFGEVNRSRHIYDPNSQRGNSADGKLNLGWHLVLFLSQFLFFFALLLQPTAWVFIYLAASGLTNLHHHSGMHTHLYPGLLKYLFVHVDCG